MYQGVEKSVEDGQGREMNTPAAASILVVDDDAGIRVMLRDYLQGAGFACQAVPDGRGMETALERGAFDLVVLDLTLPGKDGLTLCRDLRARSRLPVIMLTARGDAIDRVLGLEIGANDYLTKPFEPRELVARIRNVLRRHGGEDTETSALPPRAARFNGWTLDFERRQLVNPGGTVVMLSGADFKVLTALVTQANTVVSREGLAQVGRMLDPSERAIDLQVSRLRAKLGDDARSPQIIKTVRNGGYVLACRVDYER